MDYRVPHFHQKNHLCRTLYCKNLLLAVQETLPLLPPFRGLVQKEMHNTFAAAVVARRNGVFRAIRLKRGYTRI